MNNYERWMELKSQVRSLTEQLHEVESDIYIHAREMNQLNLAGSKTFEDSGYKIVIKHNEIVKVDQEKAYNFKEYFKVKYEFDKKKYGDVTNKETKEWLNEAITITTGKPSFTVEKV